MTGFASGARKGRAEVAGRNYELHKAITEDVLAALAEVNQENTPTKRRTLVRATSTGIEAIIHLLKTDLLEEGLGDLRKLSAAQMAMLREETYALDKCGHAYASPRYLPTAENFRFAVETFVHASGEDYSLDTSGLDWENFKRAITVRNRIVHPRSAADFEVSTEEAMCAQRAFVWATKTLLGTIGSVVHRKYEALGLAEHPLVEELRSFGISIG